MTEEVVEAISSDIISEVDMDRDMRLSQGIVDELLSIYMMEYLRFLSNYLL